MKVVTPAQVLAANAQMGLSHPDSAFNRVRKAKEREENSSQYRKTIMELAQLLWLKTENQVWP